MLGASMYGYTDARIVETLQAYLDNFSLIIGKSWSAMYHRPIGAEECPLCSTRLAKNELGPQRSLRGSPHLGRAETSDTAQDSTATT